MKTLVRAVMAAAALALAGVPGYAAPETLSVGLTGDFPSLIPSADSTPLGYNYRLNVFDQLTEIGRDGSVSPRLATDWDASDDLVTWTFNLRPGTTFHDGAPVTAADVVYTVEYILNDPKSPTRPFIRLVDSVAALDDNTVEFTLIQPYAIFDRQISFISIMSKAYHEAVGDDGYARKPIGSGPYRVVEWVRDDHMQLEAYEDYWAGAPAIKTATFRPLPSEAGRVAALMSGGIDLAVALPPSLMDTLGNAPGVKTLVAPGFRVIFAGFNVNAPPLDNPAIREAIDLAIDRDAIANGLLRGMGAPAPMMIPEGSVGFDPAVEAVSQDMARAKELVVGSGYNGEVIPIEYPNNNFSMANETVQAIAGYLTEAGLNVEIRPSEFTAFFPKWAQTSMDAMYVFAYGSTQYHADTILVAMYENGGRVYKENPEIDALVKQQRTIRDTAEQTKVINDLFRIAAQDRYNIPIYREYNAFGMVEGLEFDPYPDGFVRLYTFK
ncbi:peptide/nickel transport system substrate-binding protein [Devosia lucknowensis]|uniref:Peptide/nickel transport system substrate-binding protein n=1 Tax=Devosia lucknowensis TaxID=1096929 RepID=A0A1Y6G6I6_9HYPH|nr:ABC transporter substrate-binding protein [Devosia lucknowensis]SMQ85706.1 peptide/nickel transport system substrate-binding protein [Devosia lucknowensis]